LGGITFSTIYFRRNKAKKQAKNQFSASTKPGLNRFIVTLSQGGFLCCKYSRKTVILPQLAGAIEKWQKN